MGAIGDVRRKLEGGKNYRRKDVHTERPRWFVNNLGVRILSAMVPRGTGSKAWQGFGRMLQMLGGLFWRPN